MKKFNWLMMLVATAALSFAACTKANTEEPKPGPEPGPGPDVETLTFAVEVGEVTASSVSFTVTPSDLEAEYLCVLYDAETVEEFTKDEYLIATLFQELEAEARTTGKTLAEFMPEVVDKGVLEDTINGLAPESNYYLVIFGVDAENNYEANTEVVKHAVTTIAAPTLDVTFEIETNVDGNSAQYVVTPSDPEAIWYFYTVPTAAYDQYTDPEIYGMSPEQFLLYCLQMQIDEFRAAGYDDNTILNSLFHKGTLTLEAKNLNANTDYTNMVAGFIIDETGVITLATELTTSEYTTGAAKAVEMTFDVYVDNIEADRADIKITPSDNNQKFCWMCAQWDGVMTAEEVMNEIVTLYGGWMNAGMMLYSGVQDFTSTGPNYKYRLASPDTDYYVIAFGYSGGVTTAPEMVTFRTAEAPSAAETEFTMTASAISPYGFTVGVGSSVASTYYTLGICVPEEYNEEVIVEEYEAGITEILEMQQMYDPNVTLVDVLSMYFYKGNYNITVGGMAPETTVMGYVCAIDHKTGKIAKVQTFEDLATTASLGSVNPTVEHIGNYSGDEENGSVFGQPDATKGRAISVFKYADFDGARSLFVTLVDGNVVNETDPYLWDLAMAYWGDPIKMNTPYSFYVTDWDMECTALAYAVDSANGQPGAIGRALTMPTVENKQPIEELSALVNELNSASQSSVSMPASVVVAPAYGITLKATSLDAVVAPVAEPKRAEAPAVVANNEVVIVNYIRPFYL